MLPEPADATTASEPKLPTADDVVRLAQIATQHDLTLALQVVASRIQDGTPPEAVCVHLLAPTARLLGDRWQDETLTFEEAMASLEVVRQVLEVVMRAHRSNP